ncbi:hypothetical protein [Sagittula sp. SSi028]|uniref:hypothetical protein n=1 Tax=Sagittula sp. SSi028 TaxID=3400636 RepID=UPI003AF9EA90
MAERLRSHDGVRETKDYLDDTETPSQQGRAQGNLERNVGTQDDQKRAEQDRAGATRVTKSLEEGQGNLGGHHGTDKGSS